MQIQQEQLNGVTVLTLDGRFDAPAASDVEQTFRNVLDSGAERVALDLSGVEYISSTGLRMAIMLVNALERRGGKLVLCGLNPFVSEVFDITHLADRFIICPTRADALALVQG